MAGQLHRLDVDHSEHQAALLDAVRRVGAFDLRMVRLATGDYLIDEEVLIERKTIADFAASLADGSSPNRVECHCECHCDGKIGNCRQTDATPGNQ